MRTYYPNAGKVGGRSIHKVLLFTEVQTNLIEVSPQQTEEKQGSNTGNKQQPRQTGRKKTDKPARKRGKEKT